MNTELQSLYEQGLHQEVIQRASQLSIHPASDPHTSLIVAASLLHTGQLRRCQSVCAALEPVLSKDAQYLTLYGACLRRAGEHELSAKVFRHGLSLYPDHPTLNNNYANLLIEKGDLTKAREILLNLVAKHPNYGDARINLERVNALTDASGISDTNQESSTQQDVEALLRQASAKRLPQSTVQQQRISAGTKQESTPPEEIGLDPLRLAFSEDEVRTEQEERRKRKQAAKARQADSRASGSWEDYPDLPPVPKEEHDQELAKAAVEALVEKQPRAALILAEMLRASGSDSRHEAYTIAAEAHLMLKQYFAAEILYLSLQAEGQTDFNALLNMAALALERHDASRANVCLEQAAAIHPDHPRIAKLKEKAEAIAANTRLIALHPYVGYP